MFSYTNSSHVTEALNCFFGLLCIVNKDRFQNRWSGICPALNSVSGIYRPMMRAFYEDARDFLEHRGLTIARSQSTNGLVPLRVSAAEFTDEVHTFTSTFAHTIQYINVYNGSEGKLQPLQTS